MEIVQGGINKQEMIYMMRYGGYGMMGYGWGWLMMLGTIVLIVLGVVVLVRYLQRSNHTGIHSVHSNAIDILNEKYAKGEITDEEYRKKKAEIKS